MEKQILEKYIDYIENFDEKEITVAFQFVSQAAGSMLQESLINGHEKVLSIISLYTPQYFYLEFLNDKELYSLETAVHNFTDRLFKGWHLPSTDNSTQKRIFSVSDLSNTEAMKKFKSDFETILLPILKELKIINRKNLFLASNFAYAHIKNIDISKIKVIFKHHHEPAFQYDQNFSRKGFFLSLRDDFPNMKVIANIRHFIDASIRNANSFEKLDAPSLEISHLFFEHFFWLWFYNVYDFLILEAVINKNIKFIKFEDLHLKTEATMRDIADFLGIDYQPCLLESSFEGELFYWAGYDGKETPKYGTNPNYNINAWKEFPIEPHTKLLYAQLFNSLCKHFGYEECTDYDEKSLNDIYKMSLSDKRLLSRLLLNNAMGDYGDCKSKAIKYSLPEIILIILKTSLEKIIFERKTAYFYNIISLIKNIKYSFFDYPKIRKKRLQHLLSIAREIDETESVQEFTNFYTNGTISEGNLLIEMDFKTHLKNIAKKYRNKSILIYGYGKLFETICKKYDLSNLNIIGVCDKKFEAQESIILKNNYKSISLGKIDEHNFDIVLISLLNTNAKFLTYINDEFLKNKKNVKIDFLYKKNTL